MKLLEFLRDNEIFEHKALSELRDSAALARRTIYQELYFSKSDAAYYLDFEQLSEYAVASAAEDGIQLSVLHETAGWVCDTQVYEGLGGITKALSEQVIPLRTSGGDARLAVMTCPDNDVLIDRLKRTYAPTDYSFAICSQDMWRALHGMYAEPLIISKMAFQFNATVDGSTAISDKSKDSEARQFYTNLMNIGVVQRASDVRIIPCSTDCAVVFRIDGENHEYTRIPKEVGERIVNILKTDGKITTADPRLPLDGKVRYSPSQGKVPGDELDLRVSIIPTKGGLDLNVRYLSDRLYTFDDLGMSAANIVAYKELLELPSGLIVQVGPTGSGKSTTLYAGLAYIHQSLRSIITVEDPVEILMDGIGQVDVNADNKGGLVFSEALKACLRHDPDVVVVGELRDPATAFEAVRAANTGHLVLTSLHTNDSIGAFERLVNLGIDSYSLGEVIAAVMGQRLVRRLCPYCKEPYELDLMSPTARMYLLPEQERSVTFYRPKGCVHCNNTGYHGRVAINEVLRVDRGLRDLIQKHAVRKYFEDYLREAKFKTMYQDGIDKAVAGVTSLEELTKFAKDAIAFKG